MSLDQPRILIVGAADTGRAPMGAALLRRMLSQHELSWSVASAGVVGHDDASAEPEARDAMAALNLDIGEHLARSLSDELADWATLLLAIDSGIARVLRARYPELLVSSLGELVGRQRDIPDPFRMQVGAWVTYAREIESMLAAGLEQLLALVDVAPTVTAPEPPANSAASEALLAAVERCERILALCEEMPGIVDWPNACHQLDADLVAINAASGSDTRLVTYVNMAQTLLGRTAQLPQPAQFVALRRALDSLRRPLDQAAIDALQSALDTYDSL